MVFVPLVTWAVGLDCPPDGGCPRRGVGIAGPLRAPTHGLWKSCAKGMGSGCFVAVSAVEHRLDPCLINSGIRSSC